MLKTHVDNQIWLVHQPDHARVSGYLAAHWGNTTFAQPGYFASTNESPRIRQEVIQAIAEHDNGWWEWEANPSIDPEDGLPYGLLDVGKETADAGLQRWWLGVPRFAEQHPYMALLISYHAYWLYAFAFPDEPSHDKTFLHPLFGAPDQSSRLVSDVNLFRSFLEEQRDVQDNLQQRLLANPLWEDAVDPGHLYPHVRLLQLLDAMSLLLSFGGRKETELADVPQSHWDNRVSIRWKPLGDRRILCEPYPFAIDPLEVLLPVRILTKDFLTDALPITRLHSVPLQTVRFELTGKK